MSFEDPSYLKAMRELLLALADDALIQAQRASEWCGRSPILEEDIAFANLALDEFGHAGLFYGMIAEIDGADPVDYPDRLVYFRDAPDFRCAQLVELPNGDWAFSMLRQYFFDAAKKVWLDLLGRGSYQPAVDIAARIAREEMYHLRHTTAWVRRLSLGTDESHARMQRALREAWPYTAQLLSPPVESASLFPDRMPTPIAAWDALVLPFLSECLLAIPEAPRPVHSRCEHTPHLAVLLAEMQSLPRRHPEARW